MGKTIKADSRRVANNYALREGARRVAKEWHSEGARKKYLKKHPNANPKNHTVKKKNDGRSKGSEPSKEHLKAAGVPEGTNLPDSTKAAIATEEGREAISNFTVASKAKAFGKKVRDVAKDPKKLFKAMGNSAVREVRNVAINTPQILIDCIKEGRMPSSEKKRWPKGCVEVPEGSKPKKGETKCSVNSASEKGILYGSAVYACGVAVTAAFGGATGIAAPIAMGKAFLNSLTLHIGIGSVAAYGFSEGVTELSGKSDELLLHGEVAQDAAIAGGGDLAELVGNYGSGTIDGLGSIFEAIANTGAKAMGMLAAEDFQNILEDQEMIRLAKEEDEDALMEKFMDHCLKTLCDKLDQGFSQKEIKSLLELDPKDFT